MIYNSSSGVVHLFCYSLTSYLGYHQEAIKETMERVPLLKEIVDHYGGPDRVTAKKQREELERVAKTLPANVPDSVKQFTDRAVLSLQVNVLSFCILEPHHEKQ